MSRDYRVYLEDMLEAIGQIEEYTEDVSIVEFDRDRMRFDAVIRNLEVIGEAAKQIPESVREINPDIEWRKIAGLRDILIHKYFDINKEIVWDVVQTKLPVLKAQIVTLIKEKLVF